MDTVPITKPSNFNGGDQLMAKQLELLEKTLTKLKVFDSLLPLLTEMPRIKKRLSFLQKRIQPPPLKNPSNLEPGNFFTASNDYGSCKVSITGIVQKYSCGLWHELYEYTAECKSHNGLDTYITFGQAASVSDITARYFLSNFSMEF